MNARQCFFTEIVNSALGRLESVRSIARLADSLFIEFVALFHGDLNTVAPF